MSDVDTSRKAVERLAIRLYANEDNLTDGAAECIEALLARAEAAEAALRTSEEMAGEYAQALLATATREDPK